MTPAESAEFSLQIRDLLLGLSLLISSASLLLHWHRGRKVVVMEFGKPSVKSAPRGRTVNGQRPKLNYFINAPILINNETRHPIRIESVYWYLPQLGDDNIISERISKDRAVLTVPPNHSETMVVRHRPDWSSLEKLLNAKGESRLNFASISKSRSSIIICFSLNIQSTAFWCRAKKRASTIEIPASTITNAIRDQ